MCLHPISQTTIGEDGDYGIQFIASIKQWVGWGNPHCSIYECYYPPLRHDNWKIRSLQSIHDIYIYAYVLYPLLLTVDIMIASPHDIVQGDMARIQFVSSARCSPQVVAGILWMFILPKFGISWGLTHPYCGKSHHKPSLFFHPWLGRS